jgi:hypothetical protein
MFLAGHSVTDGTNESPLIAAVFGEDVVIPATSAIFSSFGKDPVPSIVDPSKSTEPTTGAAAA